MNHMFRAAQRMQTLLEKSCNTIMTSLKSGSSCISDEIKLLLIPRESSDFFVNGYTFVNENLLLRWNTIKDLFAITDYKNPTFSYEFCLNVVCKLQHVWKDCEKCGRNVTKLEYLEWIGCEVREELINDFNTKDECATKYLENILFLTSIIEHGLGDIYSTLTSTSPPHLLRDLLATKELKHFFGDFQIFFLQILIGHPNGVNLRNIVWHGFPSIDEINPFYYFTLLSIISSYGLILKEKQLLILHRQFTHETVSLLDKIKLNNVFNIEQFKTCLLKYQYITPWHSKIWAQILEYYNIKNVRCGVLLLLPQIEMTLRLIYSEVNRVDITAKIDKYYFILDTVLEEYLDTSKLIKNNIYVKVDSGILKLIYDIFQSQTGPRLRDKISHGDLLTSVLNFEVFEKLLYFVSHLINFQSINYEIIYHPSRVLIESFKALSLLSCDVATLNIPIDLLNNIKNLNLISINFNANEFTNLKVFYRTRNENEIIGLLIKIVDNFKIALNNLIYNLNIRIERFTSFRLHSKRRETLRNFISNLDAVLNQGIYRVCNLLINFFAKIQHTNCMADTDKKQIDLLVKFLKKLLKFSENIGKYLHIDHNQWLESVKLTTDLNKVILSKTNVLLFLE